MNFLTNILKEKYLTKIILDYKDDLEYKDILDDYDYENDGIINWNALCIKESRISLGFLELYQEYINWNFLSMNQSCICNIKIIRKYKEKLNWLYITDSIVVTEEFVEEFSDFVNWNFVSSFLYQQNQSFTLDFLKKWKYKLNWNILRYNGVIPPNVIDYIVKTMEF